MVAIRTIGPQVCQIIQYNDAATGPNVALLLAVNGDGTVNLASFVPKQTTAAHNSVHYDNLCSVGSWSYIDPPVSDARCDGPLLGQSVIYQTAAGPQMAFITSVNPTTAAITLVTWSTTAARTTPTVTQYDYTGTIVGTWRYHDPPLSLGRTNGPRIGQSIIFNGATARFVVAVNSDGTINTQGGDLSVSYDQSGLTPNTWRYPDPAVN
jgi:hypothetical protein